MSYDAKCLWLAKQFLEDYPDLDDRTKGPELAQVIQTAIEEFLEEEGT